MVNNTERFVVQLKKQLIHEFEARDRKGIYAYTQKNMAYNSSRIEGNMLTSEQTAFLFDTGTILAADADFVFRTKDIEEMQGHFKMFDEVLKNLDCPLSTDLIKRFHYQLKIGVFEDYANGYPVGEFRNQPNFVSDIATELPQNIPARIDGLVERYNHSSQTLLDIAKFHAEYEKIHPFQDGNGRTGRAIILKQCLDSNLVPVIISDNDKLSYYHALHVAQVDNDFSKLVAFLEDTQDKCYSRIRDFIDSSSEKNTEYPKDTKEEPDATIYSRDCMTDENLLSKNNKAASKGGTSNITSSSEDALNDDFDYEFGISEEEQELRFREAIRLAKEKSRIMGKTICEYDDERDEPYLLYPDGHREYLTFD